MLKRLLCLLVLTYGGPEAVSGLPASGWRVLDSNGTISAAGAVRLNRPCPALTLPASWRVLDEVYADVTGDGQPECLLALWRPWRDWPTRRWQAQPSRIAANHDAAGLSAHLAVLRPLGNGRYQPRWVGSALYQPIIALTVLPGGRVATLETTYARGPGGNSVNVSVWSWTGFGFRREARWPVVAKKLAVERSSGKLAVR
ncbi:hypothetical protein [Deinococcus ruber]|uniref:Uncharacterized protein n=1 Tax=Deinococcus ruber TaxID=1848197 RepID=A0A918CDF1_9DEIO|nr:hypothetical protein [Deinococcus ruber]GGR18701.1 hypothetical protein GCM10008957_34160 [Deinococcus ruber]